MKHKQAFAILALLALLLIAGACALDYLPERGLDVVLSDPEFDPTETPTATPTLTPTPGVPDDISYAADGIECSDSASDGSNSSCETDLKNYNENGCDARCRIYADAYRIGAYDAGPGWIELTDSTVGDLIRIDMTQVATSGSCGSNPRYEASIDTTMAISDTFILPPYVAPDYQDWYLTVYTDDVSCTDGNSTNVSYEISCIMLSETCDPTATPTPTGTITPVPTGTDAPTGCGLWPETGSVKLYDPNDVLLDTRAYDYSGGGQYGDSWAAMDWTNPGGQWWWYTSSPGRANRIPPTAVPTATATP